MNRRHFEALFKVELRRVRAPLRQFALVLVAGLVAFPLLGSGTTENLTAVTLGVGMGAALLFLPFGTIRDKLDGTLEFLTTLPVTPGTLAAAKFASAALLALPWAGATGAIVVVVPPSGVVFPTPVGAAIGVTVVSWLLLVSLSWVALAFSLWFDEKRVALPLLLGLALALSGPLVKRVLPAGFRASVAVVLLRVIRHPLAPLGAAIVALMLVAICGWLAFGATRLALERYRPKPARR